MIKRAINEHGRVFELLPFQPGMEGSFCPYDEIEERGGHVFIAKDDEGGHALTQEPIGS